MGTEANKKIILRLFEAINSSDWATIEIITHDEIQDSLISGWKTISDTVINPWEPFLRALGFDEKYLVKFIYLSNNYEGKTAFIKTWELVRQIMSEFDVYDLIAERETVICKLQSSLHLPNGDKVTLDTFAEFLIRDSKLIAWLGTNRLLNSLQQYGKITIQRNDEQEIEKYMTALKKMGLIPENL